MTQKKTKDKREYPNGFYLIDNRITMFGQHRATV